MDNVASSSHNAPPDRRSKTRLICDQLPSRCLHRHRVAAGAMFASRVVWLQPAIATHGFANTTVHVELPGPRLS